MHVTVAFKQRLGDLHVAFARGRIDVGCGAADDGLEHFRRGLADADRVADGVVLGPGRPAVDVEVGSEPQGIDRTPDPFLKRANTGEIDDRNLAFRMVGEVMAGGADHLQRPSCRFAQEFGEPEREVPPTCFVGQPGPDRCTAVRSDGQDTRIVVVGRADPGDIGQSRQHGEGGLGHPGRRRRVEP